LAEFSGNSFFVSIMNQLRPHMLFAMNITKTLTSRAHRDHINLSRLEHLDIIAAILDEDSDAARATMRRHIENGTRRIFQQPREELTKGIFFTLAAVAGEEG